MLHLDKLPEKPVWEATELRDFLKEELHVYGGEPTDYTAIAGYDGLTVAAILGDPPQDADGDAFGKKVIENPHQLYGDVVVLLATTNKEVALRLLDKIRERIAKESYTYDDFEFIEDSYWLAANTTSGDKDSESDRSEAETERQTVA
jgi:hypothetical protein